MRARSYIIIIKENYGERGPLFTWQYMHWLTRTFRCRSTNPWMFSAAAGSLLHNNAYIVENILITGTRGWYPDEKNAPPEADHSKIIARAAGRLTLSAEAGQKLVSALPPQEAEKIVKCTFMHFPPVFRDYVCREIVDVLHRYEIKRCYYGHIHGVNDMPAVRELEGIEFIPIAADYLNYTPLRIN